MGAWEDYSSQRFDVISVNSQMAGTKPPLPTGMAVLDSALGGGWKEGVNVLMGAPGTGKSGVALYSAYQVARRGQRVAVVTLEMTQLDCWARLVSAHSVDIGRAVEWSQPSDMDAWITSSFSLDATCPGLVVSAPESDDVDDVVAELEAACDAGADLLVVDYLQFMSVSGTTSDYDRTTQAMHAMTRVARDSRVPLVLVSSMGREGNRLKRPDMHCGAGSSAIEYDATTVTVMWRERDEVGDATGRLLVSVEKNRRGPVSDEPVALPCWHAYNTYRE